MTRIARPMRGRRPTKRLDLSDVKEALRDTRQWTAIAVVTAPADGSPYWEVDARSGDVMVEVVTQPDLVPLFCRLAAGMWLVPDLGDEVAVIVPAGEIDFMPVITCILSHELPTDQGPQPRRIVIVRDEVLVHAGAGGAKELAYKSDVEAVEAHVVSVDNKYATHVHQITDLTVNAPTGGPLNSVEPTSPGPPPVWPPPGDAAHVHPLGAVDPAEIVGTSVLKAK